MRGLIRKDMYCLRKNLKTFFLVTTGTILLSVLFILSTKHGNIAAANAEMISEVNMGEELISAFANGAVWLVLFIPISFLTMIVECFKEDRKAQFAKQMFSLPLSEAKIVGSRYASCLLFAAVSLAASLLSAFFVSLASDTFSFRRLSGYVICFLAVLLIYMSIVMFLIYVWGAEKADLVQCIPFVLLLIASLILFYRKLSSVSAAKMDKLLADMTESLSGFMLHKSVLLFVIAACCMCLSFWGSCNILSKRKGNI